MLTILCNDITCHYLKKNQYFFELNCQKESYILLAHGNLTFISYFDHKLLHQQKH